jgi:signal transduction histidine kinase
MHNRKPDSIIPPDDKKRLEKLYTYEIINTHAEEEFDNIANLAASIFNCPSAFISFVDSDTVFFKSNLNSLKENVVPRKYSLCSLTILDNEVTMIEDASQYDDLMESPYVSPEGGIRFYAGAPLITKEGYKLGSICVIDDKPRKATESQLAILTHLSKVVMEKLESRANTKKLIEIHTEYINRTVHDMKNYLSNLLMATDLLNGVKLEKEFENLPAIINRNAKNLSSRMDYMLNLSKIESGAYTLSIQHCNISKIVEEVINNYSVVSNAKGQKIIKEFEGDIFINADCKAMTEIFENLFSNAVKYSNPGTEIIISLKENEKDILVSFKDNGQGLSENDLKNLFIRYAKLSSVPTAKESSNGVGLTIVKILVELHKGKIWAESEGKNKGTTFFVSLPKDLVLNLVSATNKN